MAAAQTLTYDIVPPRRPTLDDIANGATKVNDPVYPPDPGTQPTADEYNQMAKQIAAITKCNPVAVVWIKGGATPSVGGFGAEGSNIITGTFTVVRNAAGDVSVTVPANTLPPSVVPAVANVVADVEIDRVRAIPIANGWQVKTKLGAAGTDVDFVLTIY